MVGPGREHLDVRAGDDVALACSTHTSIASFNSGLSPARR